MKYQLKFSVAFLMVSLVPGCAATVESDAPGNELSVVDEGSIASGLRQLSCDALTQRHADCGLAPPSEQQCAVFVDEGSEAIVDVVSALSCEDLVEDDPSVATPYPEAESDAYDEAQGVGPYTHWCAVQCGSARVDLRGRFIEFLAGTNTSAARDHSRARACSYAIDAGKKSLRDLGYTNLGCIGLGDGPTLRSGQIPRKHQWARDANTWQSRTYDQWQRDFGYYRY